MSEGNQKPLAVGIEMPAGQWILEADGTLHFSGGDFLVSGAFGSRRSLVKRIVIDDFWFVGERLFESFPECEEVVFNRQYVQISSLAFAHCPKLKTVHYTDAKIEEDSFRDTPYQAALDGVPYVPEGEREQYIGRREYGRKFLELIHKATEEMKTEKGPHNKYDRWAGDSRVWFEDSIFAMLDGRRAGEPAMMFLFAELFNNSTEFRIVYCTDEEINTDPSHWYLEAAKAGSPHAILWCAWCMEKGINGFPKDPLSSAAMLDHLPEVPRTLGLSELAFLKDEVMSMVEQAYDADLEEDEIGDSYNFEAGTYEHLLPDPDWRILHLRYVEICDFMVDMGLPYILEQHGYNYEWDMHFQDTADRIKSEKTSLAEWCREKGMNIVVV